MGASTTSTYLIRSLQTVRSADVPAAGQFGPGEPRRGLPHQRELSELEADSSPLPRGFNLGCTWKPDACAPLPEAQM